MIEEFVSRSFVIRNAAQLAHWRCQGEGSFARHEALGDLYEGIVSKIDDIVEVMQGHMGEVIGPVKLAATDNKRDLLAMVKDECAWVTENRSEIADNHPAIENMLDELCALYLKTAYKLKFLR